MGAKLAEYLGLIMEDNSHIMHHGVVSSEGKSALKTILAWLWKAQCLDMSTTSSHVFPGSKIDKLARAIQSDKLMKAGQSASTHKNKEDTISA
jgi:hypothetical protein